jgi:hypothetical protein
MSHDKATLEISFAQLFGHKISDKTVIDRIEIPMIQRDYAQGRKEANVERIRDNFLATLVAAVMPGGKAISLDFVYGNVENGAFYPLDGQQRLTTLFLLHWYLAWRAKEPIDEKTWTKFTYATRPGARQFCTGLAKFQPSSEAECLSDYLIDQDWYLYPWQHDPTIQSMLVMLDAIHGRLNNKTDEECRNAWKRLIDSEEPAISFHVLSMKSIGLTDDLYIKMNSRGKPLTDFENFKAHFEEMLRTTHPVTAATHFAEQVDTTWSNILWVYRGEDNLIDDEFIRYFRFITEISAWRSGVLFGDNMRIDDLSEAVYKENDSASEHLEFLFNALDVWEDKNIKVIFESVFAATTDGKDTPLILFNAFDNVPENESPVDLFAACCRLYGQTQWTLSHTLLLYAVLLSLIHKKGNLARQMRILRNLIEASDDRIRKENMQKLLADVKHIIVDGSIESISAFHPEQVKNENEKIQLLDKQPALKDTLCKLEDHILLRGCLAAFDLKPSTDPTIFIKRADTFSRLFSNPDCWKELTGALLAMGDYSYSWDRWGGYRGHQFGVIKNNLPWRELLKNNKKINLGNALNSLLDQVVAADNEIACLQEIQRNFIQNREASKKMDWRYYLVKYPDMRIGKSGRYVISPCGYGICMLDNLSMRGYYRDPYLYAIWRASGLGDVLADPWPWFSGYETVPRRMILKNSGVNIQSVDQGWQIFGVPTDPALKDSFDKVFDNYGIGKDLVLIIPQNNNIDMIDRVELGAPLLKDLVNAGEENKTIWA